MTDIVVDPETPGLVLTTTSADGRTSVVVEIAVAAGGRVRQITIERDGVAVGVLSEPPVPSTAHSTAWGAFPMAPWAGRIRNGRFAFDGRTVGLGLNHDDNAGVGGGTIHPSLPPLTGPIEGASIRRHSIHGTTFQRPWTVVSSTAASCSMTCPLTGELDWPFDGVARHDIRLEPAAVVFELSVQPSMEPSGRGQAFPASIGWHPWFAKPDQLDFHPDAMYEQDTIGLPTGRLIEPSTGPWDDCFVNHRPVELHYDRATVPLITVSSDCDHWVVYDKPADATCVEPQSGPPDGPNVRPVRATPERPVRRTMTIAW